VSAARATACAEWVTDIRIIIGRSAEDMMQRERSYTRLGHDDAQQPYEKLPVDLREVIGGARKEQATTALSGATKGTPTKPSPAAAAAQTNPEPMSIWTRKSTEGARVCHAPLYWCPIAHVLGGYR
jgi:hypothetical protein